MTRTDSLLLSPNLQTDAPLSQPGTIDFRRLYTNTIEGYIVTDGAGTIQETNLAAATLLQTSQSALRGKPILRYLAQKSRKLFLSLLRRLHPSTHAEAWDVFLQPQLGPLVSATLTVIASQDLGNKFITLHCHLTNVNSQLKRDMRLESHEYRRTSPEGSGNVTLCTHDLNGTLLFVSRRLSSALGYQTNQMIGHNFAEFLIPADHQTLGKYLELAQHKQTVEGSLRLSTKNGDEHVLSFHNARYEVAGHPLYVHLYANDNATRNRVQTPRLPIRTRGEHRIREQVAELAKINVALQKEVADRKRTEQGLQEYHNELERRVAARTVEITQTNILLEQEIHERKQAQEALRNSEARYRLLSASAPIGIAQADTSGSLVYTNTRWQTLAGMSTDDTLGNGWLQAVHPDDRDSAAAAWTSAIRIGREFSHEWRFVHPNGEICWVRTRATPLQTSEGQLAGYVSTLEDITSQKEVQAVLQEEARVSRGQTSALAQTLKALTAEPALDSFLSQVLTAIAQQLKAHRACLWLSEESKESFSPYMTFENGSTNLISHGTLSSQSSVDMNEVQFWPELVQAQRPIIVTDLEHETRLTTRELLHAQGIRSLLLVPLVLDDEATGWVSIQSTAVNNYRPEELELAQALAQQVALAMQLANFAEQRRQAAILEERNRLAREIHDTLAQGLTGIVLQLEVAKEVLATAPEDARSYITRAAALARDSLAEARRSVRALHPQVLDHQDIPTALERLSVQFEASTRIPITFSLCGTPYSLPTEVAANLLRISQEAIINAWKHAQPRAISLVLEFDTHEVRLHVQDDGRGFDTLTSLTGSGFGLTSMRERAERLGGHLTLTTAPGQGTKIAIKVPNSQLT